MPLIIPNYDKTLSEISTQLAHRWIAAKDNDLSQFKSSDISSMNSWQRMEFLNQLLETEPPINGTKVEAITQTYGLKSCHNSEIRSVWIRLGLRAHWKGCIDESIHFITSQGRMKFLKPIYRALYAWEETRQLSINTFKANSYKLMGISVTAVAKELHLK